MSNETEIVFKCDKCIHCSSYRTEADEYPPHTSMPTCSKGYWHGVPQGEVITEDPWVNCADFAISTPHDRNNNQ